MATSVSTTAPDTAAGGASSGAVAPRQAPPGKKRLHRGWITAGLAVAATLLATGVAWRLSATPTLELWELKTYDWRVLLAGRRAPPQNIVLVLVDERTEKEISEPLVFWRPHYAALLRAAAAGGARVLGLDVVFAKSIEQWAPGQDQALAAAFLESSPTMPIVLGYDTLQPPDPTVALYLGAFTQPGSLGFTLLTQDADGFARRQELQSRDEMAAESFATRVAAFRLGAERGLRDPSGRWLRLGDRNIPLDASGAMRIHYWGPGGTFPSVSMAEVLSAWRNHDTTHLQRWFKDKVVLVGTLDPSDTHPTPFYLSGSARRNTPGVEIHANVLATILEQKFLRGPPRHTAPLLILAASALAAACILLLRFPWGPLVLVTAAGLYIAVAVRGLSGGQVLPVVSPLSGLLLGAITSYGAYSLSEGRQKRLLQDTFGRYVSSEIAKELLAYGEVPLGGTCQTVTVMFSDLRNYTNHCQGRDPRLVVEELNEYFADMTAAIKEHGGMINKFIGDGIMALFGAPVPHPDDARRAVRCALRMVERNDEFNRRRQQQGLPPLVIGIGLHTGEAVVGSIGAPDKMEYTAIGDTVNVASRIEGENKTYQTKLLISETTFHQVRDEFRGELAGQAKLKGVTEAVALYKIVGTNP